MGVTTDASRAGELQGVEYQGDYLSSNTELKVDTYSKSLLGSNNVDNTYSTRAKFSVSFIH